MRSFHPTRDSGESNCSSLGLSQAQVDAISIFYCKNRRLKKHQCALCRKLGSSDTSSGAEVFLCVSATCGRFYHPKCAAKALYTENGIQARKFEAQVASGDTFTCPVHKCLACGHGEDRNLHALQFAICRRCPKAYHRKCLPRGISFHSDPERKVLQRAWDDLLPKRILIYCLMDAFIQEQNSSFSINKSESDQRMVSKENLDKSITMGKVEATVKAVTTALEKLDTGCSLEDAMNIYGPEMIDQLGRWKHKLQLYLGPFLHGARFTSYGRHFTKLDKLKEIVDRLHWYAQDGDTIVDFSCGSNDFSCLMSKKLETVGKKCLFKNYDLFQPKKDFNFEKRNWFSVGTEELPTGSGLIIGLNPLFGVNGKLANQFIDKALLFKPKLLILIVPRETHRLDRKRTPYNLIWEDANLLAGKSFYLPGSVDVNNKQLEQWYGISSIVSMEPARLDL